MFNNEFYIKHIFITYFNIIKTHDKFNLKLPI